MTLLHNPPKSRQHFQTIRSPCSQSAQPAYHQSLQTLPSTIKNLPRSNPTNARRTPRNQGITGPTGARISAGQQVRLQADLPNTATGNPHASNQQPHQTRLPSLPPLLPPRFLASNLYRKAHTPRSRRLHPCVQGKQRRKAGVIGAKDQARLDGLGGERNGCRADR